jgi:hypothetical protein
MSGQSNPGRPQPEPPAPTYWCGRRMIWFEGDELHVDAEVWAAARRMTIAAALKEIRATAGKLLPASAIREVVTDGR